MFQSIIKSSRLTGHKIELVIVHRLFLGRMKSFLLFSAAVLLANSVSASEGQRNEFERTDLEEPFEADRKYEYKYDGQMLTGIPDSGKQHSGSRIWAKVTLSFPSEYTHSKMAYMRLSDVRIAKVNRWIDDPRQIQGAQVTEPVTLNILTRKAIETPLKFTYEDGMIGSVWLSRQDHPWISNIKRAVLNLLQVNLQMRNRTVETDEWRKYNKLNYRSTPLEDQHTEHAKTATFRAIEKTIEGECEAAYTINRDKFANQEPNNFVSVVKSIDLDRCKVKPEVRWNYRFQKTCEASEERNKAAVKSSTIVKLGLVTRGRKLGVKVAESESQYVWTPLKDDEQLVITYANQKLKLVATKSNRDSESTFDIPDVKISKTGLQYDQTYDIEREREAMKGEGRTRDQEAVKGRNHPFVDINYVETARNMLEKMSEKMKGDYLQFGVGRWFNKLVAVLRLMSEREQRQVVGWYFEIDEWTNQERDMERRPADSRRMKDLIPQLLAQTGSRSSIKLLLELISGRKISTPKAVLALTSLMDIPIISEEIVQDLINFAENGEIKKQPALRQALLLSIGSLVNGLCVPNEDQLAMYQERSEENLCPRELREKYARLIFQRGEQAKEWYDDVLYLQTVENAGLDTTVERLEKLIRNVGKKYETYVRQEAISALRTVADLEPKTVQRILMPLALDNNEETALRIMAIDVLLRDSALPPHLDHQLATLSRCNDCSKQVRAYIESTLEEVANSSTMCHTKSSYNAMQAARFIKKLNSWPKFSSKLFSGSLESIPHYLALNLDTGSIFTNMSHVPQRLFIDLHTKWFRFYQKSSFKAELVDHGLLEQLIEMARTKVDSKMFNQWHNPRFEHQRSDSKIHKILQKLNIRDRQESKRSQLGKAVAYLKLKVKGQTIALLPMDRKMIEHVINRYGETSENSEYQHNKEVGINVNEATMFNKVYRKLPTSLGVPLVIETQTPVVAKMFGKVKFNYQKLDRFEVDMDVTPSIIASMITNIKATSPFMETGVKLIQRVKINAPINARLKVDVNNPQEDDFKLRIKSPERKIDFLTMESKTLAFTREWPENRAPLPEEDEETMAAEDMNRVADYTKCMGQKYWSMKLCVQNRVQYKKFDQPEDLLALPFAGHNRLVIYIQPESTSDHRNGGDDARHIVVKMNTNIKEETSELRKPDLLLPNQVLGEEIDEDFSDDYRGMNNRDREFSRQNLKRHMQTTGNKEYDIKKASRTKVQIDVEHNGHKISLDLKKYVDERQRFRKIMAHLHMNTHQDQKSKKLCIDMEMMQPSPAYKVEDVAKKVYHAAVKVNFGKECDSDNLMFARLRAEQTADQIESYRNEDNYKIMENCRDPSKCGPIRQFEYLKKISDMLKYTVEMEYKNVPDCLKNMSLRMMDLLKGYFMLQTSTNAMANNEPHHVKLVFTLDDEDDLMNVTLKTPRETTKIKDIDIVRMPLNSKREFVPTFGLGPVSITDVCHLTGERVQTFDGHNHNVRLGTCYSLVAGDCTQDAGFLVLTRRLGETENKKEVKILIHNHEIVLSPSNSGASRNLDIHINNKLRKLDERPEIVDHGHVVVRIQEQGPYIKVELVEQQVVVYFDTFDISIKASRLHMNKQCGLCGNYNSESSQDLKLPNLHIAKDEKSFVKSYTLKEDNCAWSTVDEWVVESREGMKPTLKTKLIDDDDELYFSKVPVHVCPRNTRVERLGEKIQVSYVKISKDDHRSRSLDNKVRKEGEILNSKQLDSLPFAFTRAESVPTKCTPI